MDTWEGPHWALMIQSAGVIGSLVFTAIAITNDARERKIANLLTMAANHREVWDQLSCRSELSRVLEPNRDLVAEPPTTAESEFLRSAIAHFLTGWRIVKAGGAIREKELAADARGFFSLPLPRAVWEKTKRFRNQRFVRFVEKALAR